MSDTGLETLDILDEMRATPREDRPRRLRQLSPAILVRLAALALDGWERELARSRAQAARGEGQP